MRLGHEHDSAAERQDVQGLGHLLGVCGGTPTPVSLWSRLSGNGVTREASCGSWSYDFAPIAGTQFRGRGRDVASRALPRPSVSLPSFCPLPFASLFLLFGCRPLRIIIPRRSLSSSNRGLRHLFRSSSGRVPLFSVLSGAHLARGPAGQVASLLREASGSRSALWPR